MKKFFKILGILLLILIIACGVAAALFVNGKLDKINFEKVGESDIDMNEGVKDMLNDYTNIALFGLDVKDATFANSRSDCIMIISINEKTNDVKIASVYRDTFLNIDGHGLDKITHAYAYGRAPLALSALNTNLDLNITKYVTIDFNSVIQTVDAMGGVPITVTSAEARYIPGINSAGTYNLTGEQALAYGRIRKIDSDYVRTERMRTVLIKVFEKAKSLSLLQLNSVIDQLLPKVTTNIKQTEILSYATKIASYKVKENFGWPYEVKTYNPGIWYAAPYTLEDNVVKLHEQLFETENYEASDKVKEISRNIINKTGYSK